jgi:GntR family transcriptional regulator/MocR family aminotransferase
LSATLGDEVTVVGADAGLHVVVWLKRVPRTQEDVLIARAHAAGLGVYPISPLYAPGTAADLPATVGLVIGYAAGLDERAIQRGVRTLKEILDTFPRSGRPGAAGEAADATGAAYWRASGRSGH